MRNGRTLAAPVHVLHEAQGVALRSGRVERRIMQSLTLSSGGGGGGGGGGGSLPSSPSMQLHVPPRSSYLAPAPASASAPLYPHKVTRDSGAGLSARLLRSTTADSLGGLSTVVAAVTSFDAEAPVPTPRAAVAAAGGESGDSPYGDTLLQRAIRLGDQRAAEAFIEGGAAGGAVDERNARGATALMLASYQGHERVARLLIARGARAELVSNEGFSALHYAVMGNSVAILELLCSVAQGGRAALTQREQSGGTPLDFARYNGRADCEAVLRAAGATH